MGLGIIIGIIIGVVVSGIVLTYTNAIDVLEPEIESSVDSAKGIISKVDGSDVVEKVEDISDQIKYVTGKIKVIDPLESKD